MIPIITDIIWITTAFILGVKCGWDYIEKPDCMKDDDDL